MVVVVVIIILIKFVIRIIIIRRIKTQATLTLRWIEIALLNKTTTNSVNEHMKSIFAMFGTPEILIPDNGPQFASIADIENALVLEFSGVDIDKARRGGNFQAETDRAMILGKPKKTQRSAEKKWRKTHRKVQCQAFVNARKNTNKLITAAKQILYIKNKISDSKSNPKDLLPIVNGLIKHSKPGADLRYHNQTTIENWPRNLLTTSTTRLNT
ncbi:integrase core domain [Elysia marginata]|uniref:Integrase core domain n=1 Tax=Elysia marginata TaxID=1093978 RepID=A0AAV4J721_9GAST|nr:integrase core domain [Elysia marginata]